MSLTLQTLTRVAPFRRDKQHKKGILHDSRHPPADDTDGDAKPKGLTAVGVTVGEEL